ncbi:MAG: trigger factor [Lewinellaceae bacterium]|nr:trigger factor [Lewinellaceae bacterium]
MSKVVREDLDNLNAVVTITLEKAEYEPKFQTELDKYRKKAHLKGFRKGKTPTAVIKKMYGRSVLADVVNEMLQEKLFQYLQDNKIDLLGQPIPSTDTPDISFDLKDLQDYVVKFDLGIAPEFDLAGLDASNVFEKYAVEITDELIQTEVDNLRRRYGQRTVSDSEIKEEDLVKFDAKELDGKTPKAGGVEHSFSVLISNLSDKAKKLVLKHKVGDTFQADVFAMEKDSDEAFVRQYFLGLDKGDTREVNREFELTITEASRVEMAELNQELFDQLFGEGQVSGEEELREKIRIDISRYYDQQAEALLFRAFQDDLMEKNNPTLPDAFLRRWIQSSNEKATDEVMEREYPLFAKNLQWTLIRNKIIKEHNVEVTDAMVHDHLMVRVRSYFAGSPYASDELIHSMVHRLMEDQKQYEQAYDEIIADKLHEVIAQLVTIKPKPITEAAFQEIARQARQSAEAAQIPDLLGDDEEDVDADEA